MWPYVMEGDMDACFLGGYRICWICGESLEYGDMVIQRISPMIKDVNRVKEFAHVECVENWVWKLQHGD